MWRYNLSHNSNPYGTLAVQFYYAIQEKNGKTEYDFQPPQQETCVNSFFRTVAFQLAGMSGNTLTKKIRIDRSTGLSICIARAR